MADNVYFPGIGGQLVLEEDNENTYKLRQLKDQTEHLVLKNYYTVDEITGIFQKHIPDFTQKNVVIDNYFWHIMYRID